MRHVLERLRFYLEQVHGPLADHCVSADTNDQFVGPPQPEGQRGGCCHWVLWMEGANLDSTGDSSSQRFGPYFQHKCVPQR